MRAMGHFSWVSNFLQPQLSAVLATQIGTTDIRQKGNIETLWWHDMLLSVDCDVNDISMKYLKHALADVFFVHIDMRNSSSICCWKSCKYQGVIVISNAEDFSSLDII